MSWAIRNALPVPVLGARRRKLPTGRSLRQLTEARLRLRRSQALDPLVALGKLARPHFTSMRAPKQVQGSMDGPGAGRRPRPRNAIAPARLSGVTVGSRIGAAFFPRGRPSGGVGDRKG